MSKAKTPKPAAKKPTAKKPAAEKTPQMILCKEIADVCKLLDEESLMFLKRQADVLLHNKRVEKLREESQTPTETRVQVSSPRTTPAQPAQPKQPETSSVRVERTSDFTFNIWVGKKKVFFNKDEMRSLAKICHAAENPVEGGKRLFAWFRRERTDFIIDTDLDGSSSPLLAQLCDIIVNTYKVS